MSVPISSYDGVPDHIKNIINVFIDDEDAKKVLVEWLDDILETRYCFWENSMGDDL